MPGLVDLPLPKSAAVWIRMRNIPFHCWSRQILFSLAQAIGHPLKLDDITASQKFLTYARVQVELNLLKELLSEIWPEMEEDDSIPIHIEYENLPCSKCLIPGHHPKFCPSEPKSSDKQSIKQPTLPHPSAQAGILGPPPPSPPQPDNMEESNKIQESTGPTSPILTSPLNINNTQVE